MTVNSVESMLIRDEGTVPYVYQDHLGYWTLGVGFLVDKRKGGKLYPEEIDFILHNRIKKYTQSLIEALPWVTHLDEVRLAVLQGMVYQLGLDGLLGFKATLEKVKNGDYAGAASNMLQSLWAKQTPERVARMAKQMETGVWQ